MRLGTRTLMCLGVSLLLVGLPRNALGQTKPFAGSGAIRVDLWKH